MKALAVYSGTRRIPCHESFIDFASQVSSAVNNNNYYPAPAPAAPRASNDQTGRLTALAHELRNPLTDINLSVGMMEGAVDKGDIKMYLDIIMRSSARISDLVTEILRQGRHAIKQEAQYSVHQLLEEVLKISDDRLTLKNITVSRQYSPDDFKMNADRLRMKIAMTNIVINAVEAMGTKKGELKLITKSAGDQFIVQFIDNGCGISKAIQSHIFEPYFTNKPGGLGIGLSTTCEILRENNVGINVKSIEGRGTSFILSFHKSQGA